MLYQIAVDQQRFVEAESLLELSSSVAYTYQIRRDMALIQRTYARLHTLRNDLPAARASLAEAIDLFERLGMRRELAEARAALTDLDAKEASAA
jgi:hypothetical protein